MLKKIIPFTVIAVISTFLFYFLKKSSSESKVVAITQIAPHPSLDKIRNGIIDTLKENKIKIVFENAQGNIATATQIAQRFVSIRPDIIVAITTPSAQTVHAALTFQKIPLVFVAVTDPIEARLANPDGTNLPYVTGISDAPPYKEQVNQIRRFLTNNKNTIGIIYNPAEANSLSQIKQIEKIFNAFNGKVITSPALSTTIVSQATSSLIGKVDAIYLPNDNTVVSALSSILEIAKKHAIPVFASDPESVEQGCTAAVAFNQYAIGQQAGHMIVQLLNGKKTDALPIEQCNKVDEYLNIKTDSHTVLGPPQH